MLWGLALAMAWQQLVTRSFLRWYRLFEFCSFIHNAGFCLLNFCSVFTGIRKWELTSSRCCNTESNSDSITRVSAMLRPAYQYRVHVTACGSKPRGRQVSVVEVMCKSDKKPKLVT